MQYSERERFAGDLLGNPFDEEPDSLSLYSDLDAEDAGSRDSQSSGNSNDDDDDDFSGNEK